MLHTDYKFPVSLKKDFIVINEGCIPFESVKIHYDATFTKISFTMDYSKKKKWKKKEIYELKELVALPFNKIYEDERIKYVTDFPKEIHITYLILYLTGLESLFDITKEKYYLDYATKLQYPKKQILLDIFTEKQWEATINLKWEFLKPNTAFLSFRKDTLWIS